MLAAPHHESSSEELLAWASHLSNELRVNERLLRRRGIDSYEVSYVTKSLQRVIHTFSIQAELAPNKSIAYPPLSEDNPIVTVAHTTGSQKKILANLEVANWEIFFEGIQLNVIRGWIRKDSNFCIRPFHLCVDNIPCTYDFSVREARRDVDDARPKDAKISSAVEIYISTIPRKPRVVIHADYQYQCHPSNTLFATVFSGQISVSDWKSKNLLTRRRTSKNSSSSHPLRRADPRSIAVLMPVFDGYEQTLEALHSFARYYEPGNRSLVNLRFLLGLDNPANDKLNNKIISLYGEHPSFTILSNSVNLGFIGNCNNLFTHVTESEDILLVNSDIICPDSDWIERLIEWIDLDNGIGTVTPLSNKATIYSYPMPNQDQELIESLTINQTDQLLKECNQLYECPIVETPSCHGFCTLIVHSRIRLTYLFDAGFGRGYGEENDLSCRLKRDGFCNIAAPNVYVYHHESVSFSSSKASLLKQNLEKLARMHPNYHSQVHLFCKNDPLRPLRNNSIIEHVKRLCENRKSILHISHWRGGGTDKYIQHLVDTNKESNHLGIKPHSEKKGFVELFLVVPNTERVSTPAVALFTEDEIFSISQEIATSFNIEKVFIHSLIDFLPYNDISYMWIKLACAANLILVMHDYHWINTFHNLLSVDNRYIFSPWNQSLYDINIIRACLGKAENAGISHNLIGRSKSIQKLFDNASKIIVPSESALAILASAMNLKHCKVRVIGHDKADLAVHGLLSKKPMMTKVTETHPLNVVVIGAIGDNKGYPLLLETLKYIKRKELPIRIHIIGWSKADSELFDAGCANISGKYSEGDFQFLAKKYEADCALFLSQWPETYSYTLSLAFENELYPFVLNVGAQAERVQKTLFGTILHEASADYIAHSLLVFFGYEMV